MLSLLKKGNTGIEESLHEECALFLVLHVYGSAYDMGYAHGQLLKSQIHSMYPAFMSHVEQEIEEYLKGLPEDVKNEVAATGLEAALEGTHLLTELVAINL